MFVRTLTTAVKWDEFGETQSKRLQKLQTRAARVILNLNNDVHHTIALHALGWEPLQTERKKAKAKMMYKVLNKPRTNNMKNSFMYDGAHLWNSIPKEIRESKSLFSFEIKSLLISVRKNVWSFTCK